ncbi:MAG: zinc-ribbon domain-containing protein, partial [Chloroflexi bacterium]|nr:zinc-ribbon domain-containing protein [Chloroflexota bacterium]
MRFPIFRCSGWGWAAFSNRGIIGGGMARRRFCLNCGATAQEADIFCSNCGHKIEG